MSATRIALLFSLEAVFAGLFGYLLAGNRLGLVGWTGALILAGIVVAEPAAARTLARLVPARRGIGPGDDRGDLL